MNHQLKPQEKIYCLGRGDLQIILESQSPRFSLDALLLADFVDKVDGTDIVELGCGTGVISLLLAASMPNSHIRSVEIVMQLADMAQRSVALNGMQQQISVEQSDWRDLPRRWGSECCRMIVANPPYYQLKSSRISPQPQKAAANSELYGGFAELAAVAAELLKPEGTLWLIHLAERMEELTATLERQRLYVFRRRFVQMFANETSKRVLLAVRKGQKTPTEILQPLIIWQNQGEYSKEAATIVGGKGGAKL